MQSKRRMNEARWIALVTEAESSGLSAAQFCRDRGLSAESFYMWRKRLSSKRRAVVPESPFSRVEVVERAAKMPFAADGSAPCPKWVAEFLHHFLRVAP